MANILVVLQWLGRTGQKKKEITLMRTSIGRTTIAVKGSITPSRGTMSWSFQNEISSAFQAQRKLEIYFLHPHSSHTMFSLNFELVH